MNERDDRLKQALLHELSEKVVRAEEVEGRVRLFDFARAEILRAKRLVEGGLDRAQADERARGLDEAIVLADALLRDESDRPDGSGGGRKREKALLQDYRRLLELRKDLYRSLPGDGSSRGRLNQERASVFLRGLVARFGDHRQGRWGPSEALRTLVERRRGLEDELEEAGVSVSRLAAFKAYTAHTKEHEPEKYAAIAGFARMVEENGARRRD